MYGTEQAYRNDVSETLMKIEQAVKEIKTICQDIEQQQAEIRMLLTLPKRIVIEE